MPTATFQTMKNLPPAIVPMMLLLMMLMTTMMVMMVTNVYILALGRNNLTSDNASVRRSDHVKARRLVKRSHAASLDRPNILFLISDQQRYDTIRHVQDRLAHYDGHFKIDTPNLDRLLKSGAHFTNAYAQCAVCAPARASLRTGCTIERTGIQSNQLITQYGDGQWFADRVGEAVTLDHVLVEEYGYVSEYYGKWHLPEVWARARPGDANPPDSAKGSGVINFNDYSYGTGEFFFNPDSEAAKLHRYLDHFESLGEISKTVQKGQVVDKFTKYPYYPAALDQSLDERIRNKDDVAVAMGNFSLGGEYTSSFLFGDVSNKALGRLVAQERPWLLTLSFQSPHPPMIPAWDQLEKYWQHREHIIVPNNTNNDGHMNNSAYATAPFADAMDEDRLQEWAALYYALIEEIDQQVGKILETLGSDANKTLIVFTSDHGELLGAHSKKGKNVFYEEASHIPLIFSFPGVIPSGKTVDEVVSHLDVFATILDYVGATASDRSDGRSLRPLIENLEVNRRFDEDMIVSEWDYRTPRQDNPEELDRRLDDRPCYLIRKGNYKLMMQKLATSKRLDMMFDLKQDPFEISNLLGKNATTADDLVVAKAEHMRCLLLDWMTRLDGSVGYYSNPDANYGEGMGDITEIRNRQMWKTLGFWVSDTVLTFGRLSWNGHRFVRHEYVYVGTRTKEPVEITSISVMGADASLFRIDKTALDIAHMECHSIKITYTSRSSDQDNKDLVAYIVLTARGYSDKVIHLHVPTNGNNDEVK